MPFGRVADGLTRYPSAGWWTPAAAIAVPLAMMLGVSPKSAWLFGVFWMLKVVPGIPGLRQLRRVLVLESGPLLSVLVIFLMVLFLGLGGGIFSGARRAAGRLQQRARGIVVGGRDPDHDRDMATWCRSPRSAGWSRRSS